MTPKNNVANITVVLDLSSVERVYVDGYKHGCDRESVQVIDIVQAADGRLIQLDVVELDFYRDEWPEKLKDALLNSRSQDDIL